ncbi:hypothetical protein BC833DRAFT_405577 [Globomyces pollinis-pini]|nr:hypothetical protein BC833DRAFT_405577 [Globomyces pollinis-pini]
MEYHWKFGKFSAKFAGQCLVMVVFLFTATVVFFMSSTSDKPPLTLTIPLKTLTALCSSIFLIQEYRQFLDDKSKYFTSFTNVLDLTIHSIVIYYIIMEIFGVEISGLPIVFSVSLLCASMRFVLYLRMVPSVGPIVRITSSALLNVLPIFVPMTLMILAYSSAFYIIHQGLIGPTTKFSSFGMSIQYTLTMLTWDYTVLEHQDYLSILILRVMYHATFLICFVNLIVALMTVNVADVISNMHAAWLVEISELLVELEIYWPFPYRYSKISNDDDHGPEKRFVPDSNFSLNETDLDSMLYDIEIVLYTAPKALVFFEDEEASSGGGDAIKTKSQAFDQPLSISKLAESRRASYKSQKTDISSFKINNKSSVSDKSKKWDIDPVIITSEEDDDLPKVNFDRSQLESSLPNSSKLTTNFLEMVRTIDDETRKRGGGSFGVESNGNTHTMVGLESKDALKRKITLSPLKENAIVSTHPNMIGTTNNLALRLSSQNLSGMGTKQKFGSNADLLLNVAPATGSIKRRVSILDTKTHDSKEPKDQDLLESHTMILDGNHAENLFTQDRSVKRRVSIMDAIQKPESHKTGAKLAHNQIAGNTQSILESKTIPINDIYSSIPLNTLPSALKKNKHSIKSLADSFPISDHEDYDRSFMSNHDNIPSDASIPADEEDAALLLIERSMRDEMMKMWNRLDRLNEKISNMEIVEDIEDSLDKEKLSKIAELMDTLTFLFKERQI